MAKHIPAYQNNNQPIVPPHNTQLPLCAFNLVKLRRGEEHRYTWEDYESVCVPASGCCNIQVGEKHFEEVGTRSSVWDGLPDSVYAPCGMEVVLRCQSDTAEVMVGGGKTDNNTYQPFRVKPDEVFQIQYGSDETKTHRRILHILGKNAEGRAGRLLVSELFTVGEGGWSGFPPHKHDEDRPPQESRFEELYLFRFKPENGFGAQFLNPDEHTSGPVHEVRNRSVILIDKGYHPCVAAPGYKMYYFTVIVGQTQRSLIQYFHPEHAWQVETIPGIKDMVKHFK